MQLFDEDNEYIYAGDKLTGKLMQYLLEHLYGNGTTFTKAEGMQAVKTFHADNGGEPYIDTDKQLGGCWDDAFKRMREGKGQYDPVSVGCKNWQLIRRQDIDPVEAAAVAQERVTFNEQTTYEVIGSGEQEVYVFSYPELLQLAEYKNETPLNKIGMTKRSTEARIKEEMTAAVFSNPVIELVIKTDDASGLESTIHHILKYQGKHKEDAPGDEWFYCTVDEIKQIYNFLQSGKKI